MSDLTRQFCIQFLSGILCGATTASAAEARNQNPTPLRQEVYVWQRAWTLPVRQAVVEHGGAFSNIIVLAAEISWAQRKPQIMRVPVDFGALAATKRPIGLALRIGPFAGPFSTNDSVARAICSLASSLVAEAKTDDVTLGELQLDFDCAESNLEGYRVWVELIRNRIAPIPLTITALPTWLKQPAFQKLIAATDGYVLQVHSFEKPKDFNTPFALCDTNAALAAIRRAAQLGTPFRVALPTYGYVIAFAANGQFVGISAEGPAKNWPATARLREVRSDPLAMASFVRTLAENDFQNVRGVIWYRLPTIVDNLNWHWPTLGVIVASQLPRESVRAQLRRVEAGLMEISLVNDGELDISSRLAVEIRWQDGRLVAGDGLRGFELVEGEASTARFQNRTHPERLFAGEVRTIGWLRFNKDVEVQLEVEKQQ